MHTSCMFLLLSVLHLNLMLFLQYCMEYTYIVKDFLLYVVSFLFDVSSFRLRFFKLY